MKKVSIFMAIAAAASLASCTAQSPKANLSTELDSLSYSIGMAQTQGLKGYLTGRLDVDTAYMADFIKGLNEGANKTSKKDIAYMAGLQIGQQISNQMMKGINQELFAGDSTKTISKANFMAGFIAGTLEKGGMMTMEEAQTYTRTAMVLLKSKDLVHWTSNVVNIQKKYPNQENLKRVWAPQTVYDKEAGKYMIYWSMKHGNGADIIYYAYANKDFTDIEGEPKPLFLPANGKSCIDGDIIYKNGLYHLFYKTEGNGNGIKKATTPSLTSGQWKESDDYKQQTKEAVEGSGIFPLIGTDKYILMYDVYMKGKYQFTESIDLENFKVIDHAVSMDFHPRHGTVIPITGKELKRLFKAYGKPEGL